MVDHENDPTRTLLLDACGVLVGEPTRRLFEQAAADTGIRADQIADVFRRRFRDGLWSGRMSERDFWADFATACGVRKPPPTWKAVFLSAMTPLPAAERIARWSQSARLILVSNQRHEWLIQRLEDTGLRTHFADLRISSITGLVKPDVLAFEHALGQRPRGAALYVDDKATNVAAARTCGLRALVADADSRWLTEVEAWLRS
jgi:FMN phosphatase YigB (HAD superfamily)